MSAVADSFKGYQYYEFTVIKDLAEPSRLLAEMNSSSFTERSKDDSKKAKKTGSEESKTDDTLIDLTPLEERTTRSSTVSGNGKESKIETNAIRY